MKNILIVRQQNNQLGDLLCSLPMYNSLKNKFPDSDITLIAGKTNYPIPYKALCPAINDIIQMDRETLSKNITFIKNLRKRKYDIGIIPSTMQFSRTSHIINLMSGAKIRVGVSSFDNHKNPFSFMLNVKKNFNWEKNKIHQTIRILDIVRQIDCHYSSEFINTKINYSEEINKKASEYLSKYFPGEKLIIGIHPGAGKSANRWKPENFAAIAKILYNKFDARFLITAGNIDDDVISVLSDLLSKYEIKFNILKNADIKLLGCIISKIKLYITNDTGVMHLAGFSGGKVLSLFGPTNGYEWAPLADNCRYIQSIDSDINSISVNEVYEIIMQMLNE